MRYASYNEREYRKLINTDQTFNTNRAELVKWLRLNHETDRFLREVNRIEDLNDTEQLYYVAVDYSIPIALVKLIYKEVKNN